MLVDRKHVLQRQRLEVEPVAGVVVGRDGLRIAVHHDGLVAIFLQRKRRMAAAVIELDSLPDAVRPRPENDDLRLRCRRRLILFVIAGIEIGRLALKLGRAGIHHLVDRLQALTYCADRALASAPLAESRCHTSAIRSSEIPIRLALRNCSTSYLSGFAVPSSPIVSVISFS